MDIFDRWASTEQRRLLVYKESAALYLTDDWCKSNYTHRRSTPKSWGHWCKTLGLRPLVYGRTHGLSCYLITMGYGHFYRVRLKERLLDVYYIRTFVSFEHRPDDSTPLPKSRVEFTKYLQQYRNPMRIPDYTVMMGAQHWKNEPSYLESTWLKCE